MSEAALQRALGSVTPEQAFETLLRRFFVTPGTARERAANLAQHHPRLAERTRAAAQQALEHVVDLLGSGPVQLGPRIDWHTDFKTDIGWPSDVLADDLETLCLDQPCDVKVPWELSRCHQWVTLGRAYALDHDPGYAAEFAGQLAAWLDDNPWPCGVNWSRAMEAAVRAVNWLWAGALFAEAPEFDLGLKRRWLASLVQHGRHILDNLEYADVNGNHYLSNGVGLLFLGILLPDLADAPAWRKKGAEIVWGELWPQVHPDGVDFEQGIGYQGLVLEFWYSCLVLCEQNAVSVPDGVRDRLERMFEFVHAYTRPDGTFPQVGDNDDGRLAGLDNEPTGSHRRHLGVGAALFQRADWLSAADDAIETAVWLLGSAVLTQARQESAQVSRGFEHGGFYVMRSAESVMLVDAAEVGMCGIGGHGHNDVLSFDLWAAGAPVLVDSGTYTYSADPAARQLMRATAAHNTLRVDGQEIARLGDSRWLWLIANDARPTVLAWQSDADRDVLEALHDGYRRLSEPVVHRRRITFDKQRHVWLIDDTLDGHGEHLVELFFHPAVSFDLFDEHEVRLRAPRGDLWLFAPDAMQLRTERGWISRGYGHREPASVLVYAQRARVPLTLRTTLVMVPSGTSSQDARSLGEVN
jgi:uncharacterized heparinase superfamily protein